MYKYLQLVEKVLRQGKRKSNRTGVDTIGIIGEHVAYDMSHGFPAVTTKELFYKQVFGEMLGFWRGVDNAADMRNLGVKVWDANANRNEQWLNNPNRKGEDDLGRIYGVQSRRWGKVVGTDEHGLPVYENIDQLRKVYEHLKQGIDDRREIVTHWNPGELNQMALPPCHMFYQFGLEPLDTNERLIIYRDTFKREIREGKQYDVTDLVLDESGIPKNKLHLSMYQRSCDLPLGVPFNIAGYSWLLHVMAQITRTVPGTFNHFMHDVHIYVNQIDAIQEQLKRGPMPLPEFHMNPDIHTLEDMDTWVQPSDFALVGYNYHPAIKIPFAV